MMKLFIDTNIMMDLLCRREPYYNSIAKIATLADSNEVELFVSALSYATTSYFLTKSESINSCKNKLRKFKSISTIVALNTQIIEKSLNSNFTDFEDALQYYSALHAQCKVIITRNGKDFKNSQLPILTSEEYLIAINKK
jgi:predicted nucleic acid-binding protein